MAVQKSKKSTSRTHMKRAHQSLSTVATVVDHDTGEARLRHHISSSGRYKGNQVVARNVADESLVEEGSI
ncbi:MAG: 50S ribosomal protein L32 [Candidatus Porifericomitaceae bacterium WSBS_2022_MAG_OTU9]